MQRSDAVVIGWTLVISEAFMGILIVRGGILLLSHRPTKNPMTVTVIGLLLLGGGVLLIGLALFSFLFVL